jgi:hypothetical protein
MANEARFLSMDKSDLEGMASELGHVFDMLGHILKRDDRILPSTKVTLEKERYVLATYLIPICCVCAGSPARYVNDAWYCEKCMNE